MLEDRDIEILIEDIYNGETSVFDLPDWLFLIIFLSLWDEVTIGYGTVGTAVLDSFRKNINEFAGSKTAQLTKELSNYIMVGGEKRLLGEFTELANATIKQFSHWQGVEKETARRRAEAAKYWEKIEDEKGDFPYLRYVTVGDDRVRDGHRELDGVVKHVDDPFWETHFPPWEYNCRCTVQQVEAADVENVNPVRDNPAKSKLIFEDQGKNKHPYFVYDAILNELSKNNFGFGYV